MINTFYKHLDNEADRIRKLRGSPRNKTNGRSKMVERRRPISVS